MENSGLVESAPKPAPVVDLETPRAAPAPALPPGEVRETAVEVPTESADTDPRLETLHATISEAGKYLAAGDLYRYSAYLAPDSLKNLENGPGGLDQWVKETEALPYFAEKMQVEAEEMQQLKDLTPVFNAAGDEATYTLEAPPPPGPVAFAVPDTFYFKEIGGQWYIEYMARKTPQNSAPPLD